MSTDLADFTEQTALGLWKCPDSQLILPADAPRPEWLGMRKAGIGGSDAAALMGDNHYDDGTPFFVWLDKTSDPNPDENEKRNNAMERGSMMEPIVRAKFEAKHPEIKTRRQGLHRSRKHPILLASVDCLTDDGGGAEFKTATSFSIKAWPEDWRDGVCPPLYAWQAKHYMLVTGRSHWYVVALIIDTWELVVWVIERDEQELELLQVVETEFWATHVETGIAPDIDWDHYTNAEVNARFPEATEGVLKLRSDTEQGLQLRELYTLRAALGAEKKEAEQEYDAVTDRMRMIAGPHEEVQLDGKKVFTLKNSSTNKVTNAGIAAAFGEDAVEKCKVRSYGRRISVSKNAI